MLLQELKSISGFATPKTFVTVPCQVNDKGSGTFIMERTAGDVINSLFRQSHKIADDIDYLYGLFNLIYGGLRNFHYAGYMNVVLLMTPRDRRILIAGIISIMFYLK